MDKKVLVMTFADSTNKDFNLRVDEPKEGLAEAEIRTSMDTILASNVFPQEGQLSKTKKAEIIVTTSNILFEAGE